MRKALDRVLGKRGTESLFSGPAPAQKEGRPGRPPALDAAVLRHRRDQLQGIFSAHWSFIGWNLQRARKPGHITDALRPLASLKHPTIELLLLNSFKRPMPDGLLLPRRERKSLYSQMETAQNRLSAGSAKVMEAREALEQAHNRLAAARVGYSHARKKKKATDSFLKEREKWSRLCESAQTELSMRENNLVEYTEKIRGIEKEIKEKEAHFAQTELLRFVLSERYAFSPQTFANAAAGLPHMAWRTSMRRCSRVQCSAETSINHLIVEALKMILEGVSPTSAEEAASEIRRQVSKRNRFESVREYLAEDWPALEKAVLTVWNSSIQADARPYEIASLFLEALKAPRRVVNPLLDGLEKNLPPT